MEFRTKVELPIGECEIRHDSLIMSWGSCFADNISRKLIENKFYCDANPFGVLYNPLSVAQSLQTPSCTNVIILKMICNMPTVNGSA